MEKRIKTPQANNKKKAAQELKSIIQLWRSQRKVLNENIEENLSAGFLDNSSDQKIEPLCERLMDYVSVGHFNVYEKLLRPCKSIKNDQRELLTAIYHNIESSTDQALKFNDKYETDNICKNDALTSDLRRLSKSLAIRFVLEEQLVEVLKG